MKTLPKVAHLLHMNPVSSESVGHDYRFVDECFEETVTWLQAFFRAQTSQHCLWSLMLHAALNKSISFCTQ